MEHVGRQKKTLDEYLHRIEEAEKRDHRKLRKSIRSYFIFKKKVRVQFFGTKKDGACFSH